VGYVFALLGALLFGANGTVTKVIVSGGLTPLQLTQFRVLGACVITGLVLLVVDRSAFRMTPKQLLTLAILGVTGVAVLQAAYAAALALLPVGIALLFEYTGVLIVALVAFFFFKEKVSPRLWIAIALVLGGLAIVSQIWASELNPLGILFALLAAGSLATYFLLGERQVGTISPLGVAFWSMLFASVFWAFFSGWWELSPAAFTTPVSLDGNLAAIVLPLWAPLLWNIVMGTFLAFLLSLLALTRLSATATGIVASSEIIFAFVVAWLWLGEGLDVLQLVGAAVVLAGIILAQTARANKVVDADLALSVPNVRGSS
jgi:drug/metabolite transporter (DMT)-like permease